MSEMTKKKKAHIGKTENENSNNNHVIHNSVAKRTVLIKLLLFFLQLFPPDQFSFSHSVCVPFRNNIFGTIFPCGFPSE